MSKTLLILILTICLIINFATCQDAMLLVYKSVKENEAVVNKNVAFTITVYNVGQRYSIHQILINVYWIKRQLI